MILGNKRIDGVMTFWTSGSFYQRDRLKEGLEALGLADFVPPPSTYDANLKYSLMQVFSNTSFMVRPNKGGFNVIEEARGEKDQPNQFLHRFTFWLEGPDHNVLMMNPPHAERGQEVAAKFNEFCGLVTQGAVTRSLVALVAKLKGIALRPSGGVYWLPDVAIPLWKDVAAVIEGSTAYGKASVYLISHEFDADAIRAVRDALVEEAQGEAERIEQEVLADDLGQKALENRKDGANAILDKLSLYESLLGTTLEEIKERLARVQEMAAVAALRAAAAKYEGGAA